MLEILAEGDWEPDSEEVLLQAFRVFDEDGKGYIEANRLREALITKGTPFREKEIDAFLSAMEARDRGGGGLLGELGVLDVDIDAIFKIEKADKSWMPAQRAWYNAREWA